MIVEKHEVDEKRISASMGLSEREILALTEGVATASEVEDGLELNKGTLRKFAQAMEKDGVKTYEQYGVGRPKISKRYLVRFSIFNRMWKDIQQQIEGLNLTTDRFQVAPKDSSLSDLIKTGGTFKLSTLEGKLILKVRALKKIYNDLLNAGEEPRSICGIYKDGKLYLVDIETFGAWYAGQIH